jgi:hypothetical protein
MADKPDKYILTTTGTRLVEPSDWITVDPSTVYVSAPGGLLLGPVEGVEDNRTVFVGYPYSFPKDDYRGVFAEVGEEYDIAFTFADEEITNDHILVKISEMMSKAAFSLFDITTWNPNVALELGIAYGRDLDYYILFDPTQGDPDVLSDVKGIDRIEYESLTELKKHLSKLMRDQFGAPEKEQQADARKIVAQLDGLRAKIPEVLRQEPGQPIGGIASSLGVPIELAQTLVRPLMGKELETRGVRRGMRYYVAGEAPPDENAEGGDTEDQLPL